MIYDILKQEHRIVLDLFDEINDVSDNNKAMKRELVDRLTSNLWAHSKAEEDIFYPRLEKESATHDLSEESLDVHHKADRMLQEIRDMDVMDEEWRDKIEELRKSIEIHIREEEEDMFPKAQALLSDDEAEEMGERYKEEKQELMG